MSVYCYARVSTDKQENGRDAQLQRLEKWCADQGVDVTQVFVDEDVSAYSVPLQKRPAGKLLWDALQPGDTLVFTKVDRVFRRWADAAVTVTNWLALGVVVRILDLPVDVATPQGELFFSQMVAFSQFESRMHGQRKREVYAHKRSNGLPYNQTRPFGWVPAKNNQGKLSHWEVCQEERDLGDKIVGMRATGMSYPKIASALCVAGYQKPKRRRGSSGYYHVNDIWMMERAAAAGYPKIPRAAWQVRGNAQTPCA